MLALWFVEIERQGRRVWYAGFKGETRAWSTDVAFAQPVSFERALRIISDCSDAVEFRLVKIPEWEETHA